MTAGSQTSENRHFDNILNGNFGYIYQKNWSGLDSPDMNHLRENDYNVSAFEIEDWVYNYRFKTDKPWVIRTETVRQNNSTLPFLWTANDDTKLFNKLVEKIREHTLNMGNIIGEHEQTFGLMADTVYRVASALHYTRRGNLEGAAKLLLKKDDVGTINPKLASKVFSSKSGKTVASAWLELQYGWLPLLSDAHELGTAIGTLMAKPIQTTFRVSRTKVNNKTYTQSPSSFSGVSRSYIRKNIKVIYTQRETWNQSIGLSNPLSVAWEVTPYSFVADWFLPIGPWLDAVSARRTLKFDKVTQSTMHRRIDMTSAPRENVIILGFTNGGSFPGYVKQFDYTRTTSSTFVALPPPSVKPLNEALSVKHLTNAVALIANVAYSSKPSRNDKAIARVIEFKKWY